MTYFLFFIGVALLIAGAEILVRGASGLAQAAGITPLVVGLTVVAYGTSSPELAVSVLASLQGAAGAEMAVGNVVGSNIFNVLFILGLSALVAPLAVDQKLVRLEVPIMIALSGLVLLLGLDGEVGRSEGLLLVAGVLAYTIYTIWMGRVDENSSAPEEKQTADTEAADARPIRNVGFVLAGLALLVVGSRLLVNGSVAIAQAFGVSELVISLTIVAAGTSLPEVATSVLAGLRGQRDIAVGNVVGSNIFNILGVLGISATAAPAGLTIPSAALTFDIPVMIATALLCLPIFFTGYRIGRLEGLLFLGYYGAYLAYLILMAGTHDALSTFSTTMLYFTMPVTVMILLIAVIRQRGAR